MIWNSLNPSATVNVGGVGESARIGDVTITLRSANIINNEVQAHWSISGSTNIDARDYMNSVKAKDAKNITIDKSRVECAPSSAIDRTKNTVPLPPFTSISYTDYFRLSDTHDICGRLSLEKKAPGSTKIYVWHFSVFC
jgi:hypothetical protein